MLSIDECKTIYDAAVAKKACKGNIEAAKRYLDAGDVEGFERVCRGNAGWLKCNDIHYLLSDGIAENWYENGAMSKRFNRVNGLAHGLYEGWSKDGSLAITCAPYGGAHKGGILEACGYWVGTLG